ncbi:MAG TPA: pentapeptide repeat-containing protein [Arsenophonus apicola]|uniref:pentapeptide repeat-containing protein n=1 Tax=Arsenophonus apicola TaxID=2879119 RepID=UPI001CDBBA70|nr:pentapeptide repeat-containing protein [Arsenophonus apicola]UBX30348.1 pentapeptide repeat-containing protein [Arsenophonus apicola]
MQVSSSNGANSIFRSTTDTPSEPHSDLTILRQVISDDCGIDDKRDLQQRKREILDKLIMQRPVGAELDLRKAQLNEVDLAMLDFERARLQEANLDKARLNGANLQIANLTDATLKYARLDSVNLDYTCLNGAKLNMATLCHARLYRTKLIKADLSDANLNDAKLFDVELNGANLQNAKLVKADLQQVKLVEANMRQADFSHSNLQSSVFIEADLAEANLSHTNLSSTNFTNAKLNSANLSNANFTKAKLNGADLSKANFKGANLNGAILTGANLDKAKLSDIALPVWNIDNLDRYLNYINNDSSLLTTIDSIDEKYNKIKITLVHQLMNSLDNSAEEVSLLSVVEPLLNTLAKAPYNQDPDIINWLNNNILPLYLTQYNISMMPILDDPLVATLLTCMYTKPELMFSHNGAFIQLISQIMAGDSSLKEQTKTLYDFYLQDRRIALYTMMPDFGNYAGNSDWSNKDAYNFILLSPQQNSHYAMMMSQNQLQQMVGIQAQKVDINWHNFYLYQGQENIGPADYQLDDLFQHHFKLFMPNYRFQQQRAKFSKLLTTLQLGDLQSTFQTATKQRTSQIKLIDFYSQNKLAAIFNNKFMPYTENDAAGYRLTDGYRQQLLQAYNLSNADRSKQAETLLTLAAVFSKYSSSAIFGTGTESPNALRYFAFALMEQAHQLAPQTFACEEQYQDWSDRLLGYNNAFSCTAVLSTIMVEHIKNHFPTTLASIMPPAWS